MSHGTSNSIAMIASVMTWCTHWGSHCAYHAGPVGSGWVQKWKSSAVRCRHVGSPLASFVIPERNISRNTSAHTSQRIAVEGGPSRARLGRSCVGAYSTARSPVSSSSASHWNQRKVWPATASDR